MTIQEIINAIEAYAPVQYQENYDNAGLICGNLLHEAKGALLSLDCLEATVEEAILKNCNLIICHHPIIFKGLKKITGANYVERTIIKAIKNDVAIYAAHTNLDNMRNGVSQKMAKKLGLLNGRVLSQSNNTLLKLQTYVPQTHLKQVQEALFNAGAGKIGEYSECSFYSLGNGSFKGSENSNPFIGKAGGARENVEEVKIEIVFDKSLKINILKSLFTAHPYESVAYDILALENKNPDIGSGYIGSLPEPVPTQDFFDLLKSTFQCSVIRSSYWHTNQVQKVALCGGSGSFLLPQAIAQQADVYISADFKYHEFFDADRQIMIADIGHYESEQYTTEIFYDILSQKFTNFAVLFSDIQSNPIKYI